MNTSFYHLSGKFNPAGLVSGLIYGLLSSVFLGALYACASYYVPFIYIISLFTLAYGAGLGWLTGSGLMRGHVRNTFVAALLGFLVGLLGVYSQWAVWLYLHSGVLMLGPVEILHRLQSLAEWGVWTINNFTPTGIMLLLFWGLEALLITGMSTLLSFHVLNDSIYCEHCKLWLKNSETKHALFQMPEEAVLLPLEKGDLTLIKKLKPYKNTQHQSRPPDPALGLLLDACSHCDDLFLASLVRYTYSFDSDGDLKTDEEKLVDRLLIKKDLHKELLKQASCPPLL